MKTLLDLAESPAPDSLESLLCRNSACARLARYLVLRRGQWIDGRVLAGIGGAYAWRTRVSNLRKAPWFLDIENRYRHVSEDGRKWIVSEYRLV